MATKINVTLRTDHGKGAARRLRAAGQLPAVTYGTGVDPVALSVSPVEIADVLNSERGVNSVVEFEVGGKKVEAMISDYQYHPLSRKLLHADLVQVTEGQKVDVKIPLHLLGKAKGIVLGGKLRQVFRELPVRCAPSDIPSHVDHDISELDIEGTVSAGELKLPEGVEVLLGEKRTVAIIAADRRAKNDDDGEDDDKKAEAG